MALTLASLFPRWMDKFFHVGKLPLALTSMNTLTSIFSHDSLNPEPLGWLTEPEAFVVGWHGWTDRVIKNETLKACTYCLFAQFFTEKKNTRYPQLSARTVAFLEISSIPANVHQNLGGTLGSSFPITGASLKEKRSLCVERITSTLENNTHHYALSRPHLQYANVVDVN